LRQQKGLEASTLHVANIVSFQLTFRSAVGESIVQKDWFFGLEGAHTPAPLIATKSSSGGYAQTGDCQKEIAETSPRAVRGEKRPTDPGMSVNLVRVRFVESPDCVQRFRALFALTPEIAVAGEVERADEVTPRERKSWRE
jgi:hypothetical protein